MKITLSIFLIFLVACGSQKSQTSSSSEIFETDLWAGSVTYTDERYAPNPCAYAYSIEEIDIIFSSFDRQRLAYTNVCFQVWMPEVTDQDNPDFWRILDVKAHYRFDDGTFKEEHVNSNGRISNNRRFAWNIRQKDPFRFGFSPSIPIEIINIYNEYVHVKATMQFYFTINDRKLTRLNGDYFIVEFEGNKYK